MKNRVDSGRMPRSDLDDRHCLLSRVYQCVYTLLVQKKKKKKKTGQRFDSRLLEFGSSMYVFVIKEHSKHHD